MASNTESAMAALEAAQKAIDEKGADASAGWVQPWSHELVSFLSISILVFSLIALIMATILLWRTSAQPSQILRVFGILTIIGFSAFLLVVGYSNEQLTPIIGLFGAIAGYLLGKDSKAGKEE
ncbi:hypothetical protein [Geoalkalibacter sp.]|uniref:hypothetical protein n=1 Tax=Geoalkalibacter sp. TaxID=3041440 RepID=UPI00272EABD4|nr:hypothetical protein [Geoalkalibacter sp.]